MPRQKELFAVTLERFREVADRLFPPKAVYTQKEAAKIVGKSDRTLRKHGIRGDITLEQLANWYS